jgi:2-dehydro-3-deoxygalactonokinase
MKQAATEFLSCDWGTSSFRLRWISGSDYSVRREIREPVGVKALYEEASRHVAGSEKARAEVFAHFLRQKIEELGNDGRNPGPIPLVISGMASSTVGWKELPYAQVPFPLDGSGLRWEELAWHGPKGLGATYLISGVATAHDMMRGEESEVLGLMAQPGFSALRQRSLLILPGTHSKHLWIRDDCIVDVRTFMTGELFDVLGRHSLLRASLDLEASPGADSLSASDRAAFQEGAVWGKDHGLAGGLFRVRTRAVLGQRPLAENKWFFSGLLIGAELGAIIEQAEGSPLLVAGARVHAELYHLAMQAIGGTNQWIQVPPEQVELATLRAHALFLFGQR